MSVVERASSVVGLVFLVAASVIVARPDGPLGQRLAEWREARRVRAIVRERWTELVGDAPRIGSNSDSLVIVEFIDYQCAYCRLFRDTAAAFAAQYVEAGIVIRHAPRPGDSTSPPTARHAPARAPGPSAPPARGPPANTGLMFA